MLKKLLLMNKLIPSEAVPILNFYLVIIQQKAPTIAPEQRQKQHAGVINFTRINFIPVKFPIVGSLCLPALDFKTLISQPILRRVASSTYR